MGSDFLKNLKQAVDNGEFNSDAAKKINEINNLANNFNVGENLNESIENFNKRLENNQKSSVSEDIANEVNSEYEKEMQLIKEKDKINNLLANLIDIEDTVRICIDDMFSFVYEIEENLKNKKDDLIYNDLILKVKEIKTKYKKFINN